MDLINAVVLGLVEGITEFLPISSTGHLILFNQWFTFRSKEFADAFDIIIQMGAILAVVVYFFRRLNPFTSNVPARKKAVSLWLRAIAGILPVIALTLVFQKLTGHKLDTALEQHLFFPIPVAVALVFWGLVIIVLEWHNGKREKAGILPSYSVAETLPWGIVIAIGFFQILSIWPGTSRSAATIIGAMILGTSRTAAAEFSFFLAIPTLLGAGAYKLLGVAKSGLHFGTHEFGLLIAGTAVAFGAAWAVISLFMRFVQTKSLAPFGVYRIALGLVVLAYFLLIAVH